MLTKIIVQIGLKNKPKFLRTLAKLEYGVAIFCEKIAEQAGKENLGGLQQNLLQHAREEKNHGKMLASLIDGTDRIYPDATVGQWVSMETEWGEMLKERNTETIGRADQCKNVFWFSGKLNSQINAVIENFNGLSRRYVSLRFLFKNQLAEEFSWEDRFAFMYGLELLTKNFYARLAEVEGTTPLGAIAQKIHDEEEEHAKYLLESLQNFCLSPDKKVNYWKWRISLTKLVAIIDIIILLIAESNS